MQSEYGAKIREATPFASLLFASRIFAFRDDGARFSIAQKSAE
jgi:hypothetical protein